MGGYAAGTGATITVTDLVDSQIKEKFDSYPDLVRQSLLRVRKAIMAVARQDKLGAVEEVLKWGEPSYLVKDGSAVRIDWKPKFPDQYAVYFNCKTSLVETFKEIYGDLFHYQGNRAIVFQLSEKVPMPELKSCISMSLRYHKIKHLPLLGM